jgi:predicted secreted hydrolase
MQNILAHFFHQRPANRLAWLCVLSVFVAGCADQSPHFASASVVESMSGAADAAFARAYEPVEFQFPRDHGAHPEYRTEWWYYTGNLADAAGHAFGYQLTFFRSALTPSLPARRSDLATNQVYMAHFALTDGQANRHESFERYSRGAGDLAGAVGEPAYRVWLEDWTVQTVEPGVTRLQANAEGEEGPIAVDLLLRETRPPVLHGDRGLSQKGPEPGNASYYYSLVQIETTGVITRAGEAVNVTGRSWMDHEYSTRALSGDAVGWDWFSLQMENGAVLMFAQVRKRDGGVTDEFTGVYVAADGDQQTISADDFTMTALDEWTSPRTNITYPSGWQVSFPGLAIELTIQPLLQDQEMSVSFVYWEGAAEIEGAIDDQPVHGVGYVELTGYGQQAQEFQR